MDAQTKREIWLLAIGTALVEVPVAVIAYAVLAGAQGLGFFSQARVCV
jgi:hypothetical protein